MSLGNFRLWLLKANLDPINSPPAARLDLKKLPEYSQVAKIEEPKRQDKTDKSAKPLQEQSSVVGHLSLRAPKVGPFLHTTESSSRNLTL
jgi:hypothetical protein